MKYPDKKPTSDTEVMDHEKMASSVFDNVLRHLLDRAVNGIEHRHVKFVDQGDTAGYFAINLSDNDHTKAYNYFRSLFGIEVDPDERPVRPLHNRVLASFGNFALIQEVSTFTDDNSGDEVAYGVNVSVVPLCEQRGGPLKVESISPLVDNVPSEL